MASRRELRLRFSWSRSTITAMLGGYLTFILLAAAPVHALDPNKHLSQYMHTAWRTQDGSLPAGMFSITQTPTVFSGSYLFPAMSTGSMAFGFCLGACLLVFQTDQSGRSLPTTQVGSG